MKVYDLRKDKEWVRRVQQASIHAKEHALTNEHGLFGSKRWWGAVENGKIEKRTAEGVIERIYGDESCGMFPEFEISSNEGKRSFVCKWDRMFCEDFIRSRKAGYYEVGKRAKVVYSIMKRRRPMAIDDGRGGVDYMSENRQILEIWIEGEAGSPSREMLEYLKRFL